MALASIKYVKNPNTVMNIWLIDYFLGNFFPLLATLCRRESARRVRFAHAWSCCNLHIISPILDVLDLAQ